MKKSLLKHVCRFLGVLVESLGLLIAFFSFANLITGDAKLMYGDVNIAENATVTFGVLVFISGRLLIGYYHGRGFWDSIFPD